MNERDHQCCTDIFACLCGSTSRKYVATSEKVSMPACLVILIFDVLTQFRHCYHLAIKLFIWFVDVENSNN